MQSTDQRFQPIGFWEEESARRKIGCGGKHAAGNDNDRQVRQSAGRETREGETIGAGAKLNVGDEGVDRVIEEVGPGAGIGCGHGGIAELGQLIAEIEQQERVVFDDQYLGNV